MNEFENKLRSLPLREPPADLRRQVLAAAEVASPRETRWTWRDWLWPSPLAWAALVALIGGAFAFGRSCDAPTIPDSIATASTPDTSTLYAFHTRQQQFAQLITRQ